MTPATENENASSDNCQINFIEHLVYIGRKLVSQPDRESKTQRLGLVKLNNVEFPFIK
jgi:hypothetical protein